MFPVDEHGFEPVEVVGSGLPSAHDVFEHDAVAAPCIFEEGDNLRNIGLVLDKAVADHKTVLAVETHAEVECACPALYLFLDGRPLAAGERPQKVSPPFHRFIARQAVV